MSARRKIADLLWWSVPSGTTEEAKALTEQMLDSYRDEVLGAVPDSDWFQPGHIYSREHNGRRIEFHVRYVNTAPDADFPTAFGWRNDSEIGVYLPMDSDDIDGWTDITSSTATEQR